MSRGLRALGVTAAAAAVAIALERRRFATPPHDGPSSDHFDGSRFHNLDPGWQSEGSFLKWQMQRDAERWPRWVDAPPGPPPPARVDGDRLRVTIVNHATVLIQTGGLNLLTDPIWSDRCSPVPFAGPKRHRAPGIRFEDLPQLDAILISHNHYDHLDLPTLRRLREVHSAPIVTPLNHRVLLARGGVTGAVELDWWHQLPLRNEVRITCVPAQHFSARALSDRNRALWGGFVISAPSGHVYFAGDTGWGRHFEQIARRFRPIRLALLPIGAYLPRWFMKPAHIDPAEAVAAHELLEARTSVPMHYGTFALGDDGYDEPLRDLREAIADRNVRNFRIAQFGEGEEIA